MVSASNRTPSCFTRFASPRLKDSEEIIRKIIFGNKDVQVINENIWIMSESAISVEEYQLDNVATLAKLHGLYSPPPEHNKPPEQYSKYIQQLNLIVKFQQEDESTCKKRRKT